MSLLTVRNILEEKEGEERAGLGRGVGWGRGKLKEPLPNRGGSKLYYRSGVVVWVYKQ